MPDSSRSGVQARTPKTKLSALKVLASRRPPLTHSVWPSRSTSSCCVALVMCCDWGRGYRPWPTAFHPPRVPSEVQTLQGGDLSGRWGDLISLLSGGVVGRLGVTTHRMQLGKVVLKGPAGKASCKPLHERSLTDQRGTGDVGQRLASDSRRQHARREQKCSSASGTRGRGPKFNHIFVSVCPSIRETTRPFTSSSKWLLISWNKAL